MTGTEPTDDARSNAARERDRLEFLRIEIEMLQGEIEAESDPHRREACQRDIARLLRAEELRYKRKCPKCGERILPVLHGMPVEDPGPNVILAGCCLEGSVLLDRACPRCDRELIGMRAWDEDDEAE